MALGKLGQDIGGGKVPQDLAGPVGIVHQAQSAGLMSQGWLTILNFAGLLSVNLAIMNILPIPPLDGGRAVLILLEKYFDKNKLAKVEYFLNYGGYLVLVGLIILVTIQDVIRIVK
jgi:regulator of sigma E protease